MTEVVGAFASGGSRKAAMFCKRDLELRKLSSFYLSVSVSVSFSVVCDEECFEE